MFLKNSPTPDPLVGVAGEGKNKFYKRLGRFANCKIRQIQHLDYINSLIDLSSLPVDVSFDWRGSFSNRLESKSVYSSPCSTYSVYQQVLHHSDPNHLKSVVSKLSQCGSYLSFYNYFDVGEIRLAKANFCRQSLLCPLCALRRSAKATKAYWDKYQVLKLSYPDIQPYLLTYTVKNGPDFMERFNHLDSCLKKLSQSFRDFKRGRFESEFAKTLGGVSSIEFTRSPIYGWHPHIHMLVLCDPSNLPDFPLDSDYPAFFENFLGDRNFTLKLNHDARLAFAQSKKQSLLSRQWLAISGDSFIVDFRPITGIEGFCEVFKYALKYSTLEIPDTFLCSQYLKGRRLLSSYGIFRGVEIPDDNSDDLLDLPFIEICYKFLEDRYHSYVCT